MKRLIMSLLGSALLVGYASVSSDSYIPSELRASAYPLVTIDPYTSAWSFTNDLYGGSVKHWTGKDFPFLGVAKVDGQFYRFMGQEELEMNSVVPNSEIAEWTGKYTVVTPANGWQNWDFDDSSWKVGKAAFGTMENEPTAKTQWGKVIYGFGALLIYKKI